MDDRNEGEVVGVRRKPVVCIEKEIRDLIVITLKGKLIGQADTDQLHNCIKSVLDRDIKKIILNLKNLSRISSLGIGAIMRALTVVRDAEGDLRLAGLDSNIKNIFEITKLIGVIQIFDQNDQAIDSFK
jgi:anti-sigma B factor antagonist